MPPVNIFKHYEVGPAATITDALYTSRPGHRTKTKRIELIVGPDAAYDLSITIWKGDHQVLPENGEFRGNSSKIVICTPYVWHPNEVITIKAENTHATEKRYFQVNIDAEVYAVGEERVL